MELRSIVCAPKPYRTLPPLQRLSVMAADFVLAAAALYALKPKPGGLGPRSSQLAFALVVGHAGLLMVDNMHFQYNGMLLGVPKNLCALQGLTFLL